MSASLRAHLGRCCSAAPRHGHGRPAGAGRWSLGSKSGCDPYIASPLITPADSKCSPDLTGDRSKWSPPRALRPPPFARPCSPIGRTRYSKASRSPNHCRDAGQSQTQKHNHGLCTSRGGRPPGRAPTSTESPSFNRLRLDNSSYPTFIAPNHRT